MALAHRVKPGSRISLKEYDPAATHKVTHKEGKARLLELNAQLTALQETQAAAASHAVLVVLQGLDTAGKDGTIRHVMAQFNPANCAVEAFKVPTPEEHAHDFLWRVHRVTPELGKIGIFNRSHYEDVLVTRVQKLVPRAVWEPRFDYINQFESLLANDKTIVLKFFLHISKEEQRERLLAREHDSERAYKLSSSDWPTHALYSRYIEAYEDVLNRCSTEQAPWYVVPADHKWFRNLAVAQTILDTLEPYQKEWKNQIEIRGREAMAAREAQRAAGIAPSTAT